MGGTGFAYFEANTYWRPDYAAWHKLTYTAFFKRQSKPKEAHEADNTKATLLLSG